MPCLFLVVYRYRNLSLYSHALIGVARQGLSLLISFWLLFLLSAFFSRALHSNDLLRCMLYVLFIQFVLFALLVPPLPPSSVLYGLQTPETGLPPNASALNSDYRLR